LFLFNKWIFIFSLKFIKKRSNHYRWCFFSQKLFIQNRHYLTGRNRPLEDFLTSVIFFKNLMSFDLIHIMCRSANIGHKMYSSVMLWNTPVLEQNNLVFSIFWTNQKSSPVNNINFRSRNWCCLQSRGLRDCFWLVQIFIETIHFN